MSHGWSEDFSFQEYDEILKKAREIAEERKPEASLHKKAAFANSVAYMVTGWSGGYGGPSVREHAAGLLYPYSPGKYTFEQAVELLLKDDGPIFGPLTEIHYRCWNEFDCFDDDPEDVKLLIKNS